MSESNPLQAASFPIATTLAMVVGISCLQGELVWPTKYWHWISAVALVACVVGIIFAALKRRLNMLARVTLLALTGFLSAWLLVPTWSTLLPSRWVYVGSLTAYLAVLGLCCEFGYRSMADKSWEAHRDLIVAFVITLATMAALIAAMVSLTYAELAAIICVSFAGGVISFGNRPVSEGTLSAVMPSLVLLGGGVAFVGMVYPQKPIYGLMWLPFAPLALVNSLRYFDKNTWREMLIRYVLFGGTLVVAAGVVYTQHG